MTGPRRARRPATVLAALALALAGAPGARAQEGDDEAGGEGRVSVAVFLLVEGTAPRASLALLSRDLEQALKKNDRLTVKDQDLLLAEFAGEVPTDVVSEARGLVTAGQELLGQGRAREAVAKLQAAEKALEGVLAFTKKNELATAQFLLGVALIRAGERKDAAAAFVRLKIWRPSYVIDVERYPEALPAWEQAAAEVGKRARGSLEVLSEPDGALAFVDGRFLGVTPVTTERLVVGDHYVTLKLDGYRRRVVKARVDAQYQELVTESLPRSEKSLLVEQSLARARPALGRDVADQAMVDLRSFLFIDQAVFARVTPGAGKELQIKAYLYDLRSKRRLSEVSASVPSSKQRAEACQGMARALYADVRYDGKTAEDDRLAREAARRRGGGGGAAFYRRWWFWTAVGVAAAGAVAAPFVYDSVAGGEDLPGCPGGNVCGEVWLQY